MKGGKTQSVFHAVMEGWIRSKGGVLTPEAKAIIQTENEIKQRLGVKNFDGIEAIRTAETGSGVEVIFKMENIDGLGLFRHAMVELTQKPPTVKLVWHFGVWDEKDIDDHDNRGAPRGISVEKKLRIKKVLQAYAETLTNASLTIRLHCSDGAMDSRQFDVLMFDVPSDRAPWIRDDFIKKVYREFTSD